MPEAEFDGVQIHYQLDGPQDGPVLVLSNSLGTNLHMWDKILPALAGRFRVLRYDTRGHGQSGVLPPPYTVADLGGDLLNLLDHLELQRVDLCGLSLGGLTAIRLGIHEPSRFNRLIFANTSPRIGTTNMWDERVAAVRQEGMAKLAQSTMARWFTDDFLKNYPEETELPRQNMEQTAPDGYIGCCMAMRDEDLWEEITRIKAPCLIITGESDIATPPTMGLALHTQLSGSEYVQLNAAHLSAWERPEDFQSAVLNFLESARP
jgi:3-oxoadipate enol-lactonase